MAVEWSGGLRKLDLDEAEPELDDVCCERMRWQLSQKCDQHSSRYDCPDSLVQRLRGGYGLIILESSSVIEIAFCPWCATRLPPIAELDLNLAGEADV